MKFGRLVGWSLLVGAFIFAAAEVAAQGISGNFGILGAVEVLDILAPDFLDWLIILVRDGIHPLVWDPLLISLMALPGWLLMGGPGVVFVWKFRKLPIGGEEKELPFSTFEDIAAAAEEEAKYYSEELSKYSAFSDYDPTDSFDGLDSGEAFNSPSGKLSETPYKDWDYSEEELLAASFDDKSKLVPVKPGSFDKAEQDVGDEHKPGSSSQVTANSKKLPFFDSDPKT